MLYILAVLTIAIIGYVDLVTSPDIALSIFYLLPVSVLAWHGGWKAARLVVLASTIVWMLAEAATGRVYPNQAVLYWNTAVRAAFFVIVGYTLSQLRRSVDEEQRLARTDSLTGVANSRSFLELAGHEVARQRRYHQPLSIAFLDCDNFKDVNDRHGHAAGDDLLRRIALGIHASLREVDIVARLGGDEFAVLLPESDAHAAETVCIKVREALRLAVAQYDVTFSIGLVTFLTPPHDVEALLHAADGAMYEAKNTGKNRSRHRIIGAELADGSTNA